MRARRKIGMSLASSVDTLSQTHYHQFTHAWSVQSAHQIILNQLIEWIEPNQTNDGSFDFDVFLSLVLIYISVFFSPISLNFTKLCSYIADAGTRAIIVYNCGENKGHRVILPPAVVAGSNRNDVLYMTMVRKSDGTNVIYFTYLGAARLFSIKTEYLRQGLGSGAVNDVGPKPEGRPIVLLGHDKGTSLFFRFKGEPNIFMWNTETCFKPANFLEVSKGSECRLTTQVMAGHKKYMWMMSSNFHDYINKSVGCVGASMVIQPVIKECDD